MTPTPNPAGHDSGRPWARGEVAGSSAPGARSSRQSAARSWRVGQQRIAAGPPVRRGLYYFDAVTRGIQGAMPGVSSALRWRQMNTQGSRWVPLMPHVLRNATYRS